MLTGSREGGGGSGGTGAVAGTSPVEGIFEAAEFLIAAVEGELVHGVLGGAESLCAQSQCADAGALTAEGSEKFAAGGGEDGGVGSGFGKGAAPAPGSALAHVAKVNGALYEVTSHLCSRQYAELATGSPGPIAEAS